MSIVTSLLKSNANAIFAGVSSGPLLLSELREMRERNLQMMLNFARYSGEQPQDTSQKGRAEECIFHARDFDTRLFDCLMTRRTPGEDLHFRRVAIALEHLHDELGLPPVKRTQTVASPRPAIRIIGLDERSAVNG